MPARVSPPEELPPGFVYRPDFITPDEERDLLNHFQHLDFAPFQYLQYTAKRRVVVYGWDYDFSSKKTSTVAPIPEFLFPLRERTAAFVGVAPDALVEAVINEYPPGAPIGWHRDVPQFDTVAGISLVSPCRMRFRPYKAEGRVPRLRPGLAYPGVFSIVLEPRSAYILRDDARWKWQHSIPEVKELRYSVTFRTLRTQKNIFPTLAKPASG